MLKHWFIVIATFGSALFSTAATPSTLLVWYPGAGGSTAAAAPLMERWADYLNRQTPDSTWTITFAGTEAAGKAALAKKPAFVLPSRAMQTRHALAGAVVARSIPATLGKRTEQWFFVHTACTAPATVFTSEPVDTLFLANLFKQFPVHTPLEPTNNLVGILRRMHAGECVAMALNEREWKNSTTAFRSVTQDLIAEPSQQTIPTPDVMQRGATDTVAAALRTALTTMHRSADGKAILQELQLARFE